MGLRARRGNSHQQEDAMGYQRSGGDFGRGRNEDDASRGYGGRSDSDRAEYGRNDWRSQGRDYGRPPQGYGDDDRGFFDRAGDEVRSWFGDEEAERRRRYDERNARHEQGREQEGSWRGGEDRQSGGYGRGGSGGFATGDIGGGLSPSDHGAGRGAGATSNWGLGAGKDRNDWGHDPHYSAWRERQIRDLDRDYDEYRREHQSRFESEFGTWRQSRQSQRQMLNQVREHQDVVGADGQQVGTVDKVRGDRILLTKTDQDASGHHHSIPCSWLRSVGDKVEISRTADEAQRHWKDEESNRTFWNDDRQRSSDEEDRPHNLNRSFSGTY
jgi:hypothetical protein